MTDDTTDLPARRRLVLWIMALRPQTLTITLAPILVGIGDALSRGTPIAWGGVVAAALAALAIQVATNLANDAADGTSGLDGPERLGPIRGTAAGLQQVERAAIFATLIAGMFGALAVWQGGWVILAIGVLSILAGWAYSYGPRPIAATALGELFVIAFFGVAAVVGIEYLAIRVIDGRAVLLGIAVGLPAAAVLTVNNHRDRVGDARHGRQTLAIRIGPRASIALYGGQMIAAVLLAGAVLAWMAASARMLALLLPLLGAAILLTLQLHRLPINAGLNAHLGRTALFQLLFAVTLAGLLIALPA